jgi:aminomethyltransferase
MPDKQSPLYQLHADAGASFTDFAGWQMPVSYGSDLAEHHAVRTSTGLFDISHMAQFSVTGPDAAAFLDRALTANVSAIALSRAKYTMILDEDGGIIDDLITYQNAPGEYLVIANASNHDPVLAALSERLSGFTVTLTDLVNEALIAVQGPTSRSILEATPGLVHDEAIALGHTLETLPYYACMAMRFNGEPVLVARTGYTGEDGFEVGMSVDVAPDFWNAVLSAGATPAGLASRDTLRLEAGMPLYGHELGLDVQPIQAGLGRSVPLKTKTVDFVGREALVAGPAKNARVLVGLTTEGKRAGRAGYGVYVAAPEGVAPEADAVGIITSGALSPTLGYPIAMAYVDPDVLEAGLPLTIDVRGTRIAASVVPLPFYKRESN